MIKELLYPILQDNVPMTTSIDDDFRIFVFYILKHIASCNFRFLSLIRRRLDFDTFFVLFLNETSQLSTFERIFIFQLEQTFFTKQAFN